MEDFPLPTLLIEEHRKHIEYLKECLRTGGMGEKYDIQLDEERRKWYETFTETSSGRNRSRNISHATIIRVARRDNNTCKICGKILLDREIELDHIIPYSRGGTTDEGNLRVTCFECNRKKGKKIKL